MPKLDTPAKPVGKAKPRQQTTTSKAPSQGAKDAAAKAKGKPILFPEVRVSKCFGPSALTYDVVKELLDFESEPEYAARIAAEENARDPSVNLDGTGIRFKEAELLKERIMFFSWEGTRYCAWANAGNRPFHLDWALTIAQDILDRAWAGPTTMPELQEFEYGGEEPYKMADGTVLNKGDKVKLTRGTVNGEAIQISRAGLTKSGQHRMIGFLLACLMWRQRPDKYPQWPTEPILETIVTYGVSDDEAVTTTMDNNLSRTEADNYYAGNVVLRILPEDKVAKLDQRGRAEVCRLLQAAGDFLWQRCGKGAYMYRTHTANQRFLDDHPRIYKAVRRIWEENHGDRGRPLSLALAIPPGQMAAALYMMATGNSDLTKWDAQTGKESQLDMSLWTQAEDFFDLIAKREGQHRAVAGEIAALNADPNSPAKGVAKLVVLAKAWHAMGQGGKVKVVKEVLDDQSERFRCAELAPEYQTVDGQTILINPVGFGGIDLGPKLREPEPDEESTEAQVAERKAELDAAKAPKPDPVKPEETPDDVRRKHLAKASSSASGAPGEVAKPAPKAVGKDGKPLPVKVGAKK